VACIERSGASAVPAIAASTLLNKKLGFATASERGIAISVNRDTTSTAAIFFFPALFGLLCFTGTERVGLAKETLFSHFWVGLNDMAILIIFVSKLHAQLIVHKLNV
jgi:hypothetical protein